MKGNRQSLLPENRRAPGVEPQLPQEMAPAKKAEKPKKPRRWAAAATRWLGRLSVLTGILVVAAASTAVAWGLRRYLRESHRFAVTDVKVEGNSRRSAQQIIKRAGLDLGKNIFQVDEEALAGAILADPWIESAEVKVELPNAVRVKVSEREPRALATIGSKLYLVDQKGQVFKELAEADPHDLPVVTGVSEDDVSRDREGVTARIRRALELVDDLTAAKIAVRYPVQEVRAEADGTVSVVVGSDGVTLMFGSPPFRAKVDKAERILEELRYRKVQRAVLFLDNVAHPERVVVRLQTTAKEP
jgi:cell division protein FtsQ